MDNMGIYIHIYVILLPMGISGSDWLEVPTI